MNGLALRINRGGGGKSKSSIGYSPVTIPEPLLNKNEVNITSEIEEFINSSSSDDQLAVLKNILDANKDSFDGNVMKFLVAAFFHAEAKHPIKSFISRHIIKNKHLQELFTEVLGIHVARVMAYNLTYYKHYVDTVNKLLWSIENFQPGVVALRDNQLGLMDYLYNCLLCSVKTLSEETLSPTEKNEIFTLAHTALRLVLHIIQKSTNEDIALLIFHFSAIRSVMQKLMFDDDVPMDTKSVCGILYLCLYTAEHGASKWIEVLDESTTDVYLSELLQLEAGRLALLAALPSVLPPEQLLAHTVDHCPAIVTLTNKILEIGDRSSSESALILGVARTLLQISKSLEACSARGAGLALVRALLAWAWAQLEHHVDSVRHLAAQLLAALGRYCARTDRDGDSSALEALTSALSSLERSRKSYYVCVCCLASELGARRVLQLVRPADVIHAINEQPLRNTASLALDAILVKLCAECSLEELQASVVQPCVRAARGADTAALAVLQRQLARALQARPDLKDVILSYTTGYDPGDECVLKCVLMLLRVVRKSGVIDTSSTTDADNWKRLISYEILKEAAVSAVDEIRILSLSLVVESPKSTEQFQLGELQLVLHFLRYNINAQAPSFRQLTMSYMKKFIKRLEESYKVINRERQPNGVCDKVAYYLHFAEVLRRQCFDSLIPGANYSRRFVALQILAWCEQITLEGYERGWEPEYVEGLLLHLEDSYENNKGLALQVLASCPDQLLRSKSYSISLDIEDIFRQASSLKPTECVSAAYKLDLLRTRLPDYILQDETCGPVASPVLFSLVSRLRAACRSQLAVLERSVLAAAARAPVYGVLHCLAQALQHVDAREISSDEKWTALIGEIIDICMEVNDAVACVVNNSSPEGHLPMDMTVQITDHGNTGNVTLDDGRQVTSQMVLLCAWRCVKEVSLLLGGICSRLSVAGEGEEEGTLSPAQLERVGEHFTSLLAETKHRGAFEQAYVGFTLLLDRLWRCVLPGLHGLPARWLAQLLASLASGAGALCATRRSAGLPFIIQALVTTEVQVQGNPLCFNGCMSSLLQLAAQCEGETRSHALHVLRALARHSALAERVAPHVARALVVALRAFDAQTWAERNSSTLLLSALVQRVFGVQRCTMTGRIFFLRYPEVYDFMLEKLQEVSTDLDSHVLRPSLYPVLLLLARLYPSSLEGTVSNLKLVAFIPHVAACARSRVLHTRQLAARALVPLVAPDIYVTQIQSMFELLHDQSIQRNYCHGILLQLVQLLHVQAGGGAVAARWPAWATPAMWLLGQAGHAGQASRPPCYLIADEFVKLLNLLFMRSSSIPQEIINEISSHLHTLIFDATPTSVSPGKDTCLSNAMYLYLILATKYNQTNTTDLIHKGLQHSSYEVVLSVLNYLLIIHNDSEEENSKFHEHLKTIREKSNLSQIKNENYIQLLCKVLKNKYLECQEKSLKILVLEGNTQRNIIESKTGEIVTNDMVIDKLIDFIQNEHERVTHIYLQSLLNFVTVQLQDSSLSFRVLLNVIRVVFDCSSSENSENTRSVVVGFMETNIRKIFGLNLQKTHELRDSEKFELQATTWATIITLLEDDEYTIRQRISDVLSPVRVTPSMSCELVLNFLREPEKYQGTEYLGTGFHVSRVNRLALFAVIALLDFQSVVVVADDVSDECRVFDQNERYNIYLEETVWTSACADVIVNDYKENARDLATLTNHSTYRETFDKLCKDNVQAFRKMAAGYKLPRNDALNPKIELFVNKLNYVSKVKN